MKIYLYFVSLLVLFSGCGENPAPVPPPILKCKENEYQIEVVIAETKDNWFYTTDRISGHAEKNLLVGQEYVLCRENGKDFWRILE